MEALDLILWYIKLIIEHCKNPEGRTSIHPMDVSVRGASSMSPDWLCRFCLRGASESFIVIIGISQKGKNLPLTYCSKYCIIAVEIVYPKFKNHKSVESLNHDGLGFFQGEHFFDYLFRETKPVKKGGKTGKIFHKLYCYNFTKYRISTLEEILKCFFYAHF